MATAAWSPGVRYLALSAVWMALLGVAGPMACMLWTVKDPIPQKTFDAMFQSTLPAHRLRLAVLAAGSLAAAAWMPSPLEAKTPWHKKDDEAVAVIDAERGHHRSLSPSSSVLESQRFLASGRLVLCSCSIISLLITQHPLAGSLAASVALLLAALQQLQTLRADAQLSLSELMDSNIPDDSMDEVEALLCGKRKSLAISRQHAVLRTLIVTCFYVCAVRSLAVWVGVLEGCDSPGRDVQDSACLPSLAAQLCPSFLTIGSLARLGLAALLGCSEDIGPSHGPGGRRTSAETSLGRSLCVWLPTVAFHSYGPWLLSKVLADMSHHPIREVFAMWRLPLWEELLVLVAVLALWFALLFLSSTISVCMRLLEDEDGSALFILFQGFGILLGEAFLALLMYARMETIMPKVLQMTSALGTAIVSSVSIAYIVFTLVEYHWQQQHELSQAPLQKPSTVLVELVELGFTR